MSATQHKLDTIAEIEHKNRIRGHHFFDADTLRFFGSRIQEPVIRHRYFVTTERPDDGERRATIRCAMDDGSIETVGKFRELPNPATARRALDLALSQGIAVRNDPYPDATNTDSPDGFNWRAYVGELPIGPRTDKATAEDQARQAGEPGFCYPGHAIAAEQEYVGEARERGEEAAKAAASWIVDGSHDVAERARLLAMLRDGDPAADQYLPAEPNLSGEMADSPTPLSLAREITGDDDPSPETMEAISDAFEAGVSETFTLACEAELVRFTESA